MKKRSVRDYNIVMTVAFVAVFVCCLALALAGYFGQQYQVAILSPYATFAGRSFHLHQDEASVLRT
jgi:hypothetical protein